MQLKRDSFLWSYGLMLLLVGLVQLFYSQLAISIYIRGLGNTVLDSLCLVGTYLGDGWVIVGSCIILYFFYPRMALGLLLMYLLSSGITQLLKHTIFTNWHRPLWFIREAGLTDVLIVPGAELTYANSFPSGHTTAAFALFAGLSLYLREKVNPLLFLGFAIFVAFTRIYLLQHFLRDTMAGSFIGTATAYWVYFQLYLKGKLNFIGNK